MTLSWLRDQRCSDLEVKEHIRDLPVHEYRRTPSPGWTQAGCWTPPATSHIRCHRVSVDSVKMTAWLTGRAKIRAGVTSNLSAPIARGRCRPRSGPSVLDADADLARVNLPWDHSRAGICTLSRYLSIYRRLTFWTRTVVGKYWSRPHIATLVRTYAPEASWICEETRALAPLKICERIHSEARSSRYEDVIEGFRSRTVLLRFS